MYEYSARCIRVVDGDTLDLDVDLGMNVHVMERIRLDALDAPETYGVKKGSDEYEAGVKTRTEVERLIAENPEFTIKTFKDSKGKYGRYVAEVHFHNGVCLNDYLVENDFAVRKEY